MRYLATFSVTIGLIASTAAFSQAELVKGSRAYVKKERAIYQAKKEHAKQKREVEDFGELIEELKATPHVRTRSRDYWRLNATIRSAMERELEQVRGGQPGTPTEADAARQDTPTASANIAASMTADRMQVIIKESEGLQYWISEGDEDARARYYHLLQSFHGLMQAELEAEAQTISREEGDLLGAAR